MPVNLEIKARYASLKDAIRISRNLGAIPSGVLLQTDTYFITGSNRLKLREIRGGKAELIYYTRPDERASRYSNYRVQTVRDVRSIKRLFSGLFGKKTVVRKKRILYLFKNARIHIDNVAGLGTFLEFEVVVNAGRKQAKSLMTLLRREFAVRSSDIIGGSYSDLHSVKIAGKSRN